MTRSSHLACSRNARGASSAWRPWFSSSGDRPAPSLRSLPVRGALSCDQPRISQPLARHPGDHAVEALKTVALHVALIQPERKFVQVARQMLGADFVIDAVDASFQDSPNAFDAVSSGLAACVFASRMVHGFVTEEQAV